MKSIQQHTQKESAIALFVSNAPNMAWINIKGDSMTSDCGISIPDNSRVLIKRIPNDPFGIPRKKPLVIMSEANGQTFIVCKLITFVDLVNYQVKCESLNKKYDPFWMPLAKVTAIYEVEEVLI